MEAQNKKQMMIAALALFGIGAGGYWCLQLGANGDPTRTPGRVSPARHTVDRLVEAKPPSGRRTVIRDVPKATNDPRRKWPKVKGKHSVRHKIGRTPEKEVRKKEIHPSA